MKLPSRIQFADEKVKKAFEYLENDAKGDEKQLYVWIVRAFKDIEKNAFYGIQIPKNLIHEEYIKKYKIHNLWKYNLPNACKLLYSIEKDNTTVVSIILEWMDHKKYEQQFGY